MLKPESLIDLLRQGGTQSYGEIGQIAIPRLEGPNIANLFGVIRNTEYLGTSFAIVLPLTSDNRTGYRLRLTLKDWTWKLSGIGLPEDIQTRIAAEIIQSAS